MSPEPRKSERPTNPQMSKLAEQLRELDLQPVQEIEAPKRSREDIKVVCLKCGADFEKSPYNIFYRSPRGACPHCEKESTSSDSKKTQKRISSQSKRLSIGDLLGKEDLQKLSEVFNYWKASVSDLCIDADIFDEVTVSNKADLENESTLLRFLVKTTINRLHDDLWMQKIIDSMADAIITSRIDNEPYEQAIRNVIIEKVVEDRDPIEIDWWECKCTDLAFDRASKLLKKTAEKNDSIRNLEEIRSEGEKRYEALQYLLQEQMRRFL